MNNLTFICIGSGYYISKKERKTFRLLIVWFYLISILKKLCLNNFIRVLFVMIPDKNGVSLVKNHDFDHFHDILVK